MIRQFKHGDRVRLLSEERDGVVNCYGDPCTYEQNWVFVIFDDEPRGSDPRGYSCNESHLQLIDGTRGHKPTEGKLDYSLLPIDQLDQVVRVLMFGAKQPNRGPFNWQKVEGGKSKYLVAACRHVMDLMRGKCTVDPESGLPTAAHAICSLLFYMWFCAQEQKP